MIGIKDNLFFYKLLNRQKGFSLLELLVVIGILAVTSGFIYPQIGKWKIKRNIEKDFQVIVSTIDYLKTRSRSINGTSILYCNNSGGGVTTQTYQISSQRNDGPGAGAEWTIHPNFATNIVEESEGVSFLTGNVNVTCNNETTIFNASGNAGNLSDGAALEIEVNFMVDDVVDYQDYNAYKIRVNTATAFVEKFKYNMISEVWVDLN